MTLESKSQNNRQIDVKKEMYNHSRSLSGFQRSQMNKGYSLREVPQEADNQHPADSPRGKCPFEETCCPEDYENTDFYEKNCAGHFSNPNFKQETYENCEVYRQLIKEIEERR